MSWTVPTQIEKDFISGKALYKTFQTGNGGQSILTVPSNSYVVIFGYDFSPAGGGVVYTEDLTPAQALIAPVLRFFETQQISFYTGTDFYPFIHHVNMETNVSEQGTTRQVHCSMDTTPIARPLYITSSNDVTITVGLILDTDVASQNPIPVTNRTPPSLTYGGSPQAGNTQTNFGPAGTPQQFMQPSVKDYADFAFGLLPSNATDQAFATPDTANGLYDPSAFISSPLWPDPNVKNSAATNYFLNLHYALYSAVVPESRG